VPKRRIAITPIEHAAHLALDVAVEALTAAESAEPDVAHHGRPVD
jgi:hypothetical protein